MNILTLIISLKKTIKEKLNQVIVDAKKKGVVIVDNEKENEPRISEILSPQQKKDSFFIRYENEINLSRIVEQPESSIKTYSMTARMKESGMEEKKEFN